MATDSIGDNDSWKLSSYPNNRVSQIFNDTDKLAIIPKNAGSDAASVYENFDWTTDIAGGDISNAIMWLPSVSEFRANPTISNKLYCSMSRTYIRVYYLSNYYESNYIYTRYYSTEGDWFTGTNRAYFTPAFSLNLTNVMKVKTV